MTLVVFIAVAVGAGLVSTLGRLVRQPRVRAACAIVGIAGAIACIGLGLVTDAAAGATVGFGDLTLTTGGPARVLAIGWATSLLGLSVIAIATRTPSSIGPGLLALAGGVLGLAADQPAVAFAALTAGAAAAVLLPGLAPDIPTGAAAAGRRVGELGAIARGLLATFGAGLGAMSIVAWTASPAGPPTATSPVSVDDPAMAAALGLAIVAMAGLVVVRSGAIPAHLWAARFVGAVPALAVPSVLAWGSAAFAVVAVGWAAATVGATTLRLDALDRTVIVLVGFAGLVLGALAAALHDDVEHVLGYWLVETAGVTLFAFGALGPRISGAVADWTIANAALASAGAGWIAVARWSFGGSHGVGALRGWARRSPGLAIALALMLLAAAGLPGTALATARSSLAHAAFAGTPGAVVSLVAAAGSVVAFGRIFLAGLARPVGDVAATPRERRGLIVLAGGGWSMGSSAGGRVKRARELARANLSFAVGLAVLLLSLVGLAIAVGGTAGA